jgi:hypothetical protein
VITVTTLLNTNIVGPSRAVTSLAILPSTIDDLTPFWAWMQKTLSSPYQSPPPIIWCSMIGNQPKENLALKLTIIFKKTIKRV